jgi:ferredoxin-NADP reductase
MTARTFDDPSAPPTWDDAHDGSLQCLQVRQETHDVKTFVLGSSSVARSWRYLPGQFLTFELQVDGKTVHRCYTLSSSPTRPDRVSITVKRVPGGQVSNWLHDHLRPGATLRAAGPAGIFSCFEAPAPRYLFLSGGSGITPLMSMSRALHDLASEADVVFVHCARTPADLLFADELALFTRTMPHFRVAFVCEQQPAQSAYAGHLGRFDLAKLQQVAPDFLARDVYTCGPAPFMAAVQAMLSGAGYPTQRYRQESFSFETTAAELGLPGAAAEAVGSDGAAAVVQHRITLGKTGQVFACGADQTILQAATAADIRLPFSCSNGMCGTCKSKKLSGQVEMQHHGGIRQREIDQGWMLPCCSRPLGDVTLDR